MEFNLQFLGAAGTVTGSKYLLETESSRILIDCGLFQGLKKLRQRNWDDFPVPAKSIDAVLLTHGHMDHSAYLPCLVKQGFRGPIYGTGPTLDVAEIILRDSAQLQKEESQKANRKGYSKHKPAQPLYTWKHVEQTLPLFRKVALQQELEIAPGIYATWHYNGHIIGATWIALKIGEKTIVISGDIGRPQDPLLYPPHKPQTADILLIESTYGDRLHPHTSAMADLKAAIWDSLERGGSLILPCFAVERTQLLLYLLWQLKRAGELPNIPILLDTPMGQRVLESFLHCPEWHRLSKEETLALSEMVQVVEHANETLKWARRKTPKVVIAGSGMLTGGRVLTYLIYELGNPRTSIMLTGFQAEGTRGRQLLEGAPELKIQGNYYPVKAQVAKLENMSAHADQAELLDWLSDLKQAPEQIYIIHGEPQAADSLRVRIQDHYGWPCQIPELGERVKHSAAACSKRV